MLGMSLQGGWQTVWDFPLGELLVWFSNQYEFVPLQSTAYRTVRWELCLALFSATCPT